MDQVNYNDRSIRKEGNVSLIEKTDPDTGRVIEYEILQTHTGMLANFRKWHAGRLKDAIQIFERIAVEDRRARLKVFMREHS